MIDTHCHLLPGLDDGPATDVDAISLARRLAAEGVDTVLCTPHFSELYPTRWGASCDGLERLRAELDALGIPLGTELAAEVSAGMVLEAPVEQLLERAIGGRYMLVELVSRTPATAVGAIERRLGTIGLVPVFAHPERCTAVQRQPDLLDEARERGAWIQVVAPSLTGRWGEAVWAAAWTLIENGRADLLGSDAHRAGSSDGRLGSVGPLVESRYGSEAAALLTEENPRRLLAGEDRAE